MCHRRGHALTGVAAANIVYFRVEHRRVQWTPSALHLSVWYYATDVVIKFACARVVPTDVVNALPGLLQRTWSSELYRTDVRNELTSAWVVPTDVGNALTGVAATN